MESPLKHTHRKIYYWAELSWHITIDSPLYGYNGNTCRAYCILLVAMEPFTVRCDNSGKVRIGNDSVRIAGFECKHSHRGEAIADIRKGNDVR